MVNMNRCSTKYALASLALVALLLFIYSMSNGELFYSKVPDVKKTVQVNGESLTLRSSKESPQRELQHHAEQKEHRFEFRVVHLDLKGAPPQVKYYEDLFPFLREHGANGILIEYEDMFPYSGALLEGTSAYNSYSLSDIRKILHLAQKNKLTVIPLIQTFGHLEFFLKLKQNADMREVLAHPGSICPTHNRTTQVLNAMIDQIVLAHPDLTYLHIGSDEVYELGKCSRCLEKIKQKNWNRNQLFLDHVLQIAKYIREKYSYITPLVWEDMFRGMSTEELQYSGVAKFVEPVVWNYHPNILAYITPDIWTVYAQNFKHVWIASAFKGATGPDQLLTNFTYHLENHISWMAIVDQYKNDINFRGIMLTGWQRYDHFAVLCELLPVGIPSLILNLYYVLNYKEIYPQDVSSKAFQILNCDVSHPPRSWTACSFPGSLILSIAQRLYFFRNDIENVQTGINNAVMRGWVSDYNIRKNFSSAHLVVEATKEIEQFKMELINLKNDFKRAGSDIYDHYTIEEWIESNILPHEKKLDDLWLAREQLLSVLYWPRRPLDASSNLH